MPYSTPDTFPYPFGHNYNITMFDFSISLFNFLGQFYVPKKNKTMHLLVIFVA